MSLSEKDRAIIAATLPGNTSLTHFTDFRSSHEDLARLLSAVRQEAYKEGWNDREGDLIAGVNRIAPEEASQGAGEPVAWINDLQFSRLRIAPKEASRVWGLPNGSINIPLYRSPPNPQARIDALEEAVNKAIRILSDHKLGEPRRVLDARDVLIMARSDSPDQAVKGDDQASPPPPVTP